jgi:hypothetical protein
MRLLGGGMKTPAFAIRIAQADRAVAPGQKRERWHASLALLIITKETAAFCYKLFIFDKKTKIETLLIQK